MTIGGWILFSVFAITIGGAAVFIAVEADTKRVTVISLVVGAVLIVILYASMHWLYTNTASGQRALKSQESNFGGGIDRVVTVYSYDGTPIESWSGKFDVTEDSNETYFDIDGKRVIIQGGIIINEEVDNE